MPQRWLLVGIVLLAAWLRAWHLDAMSIWQDEALSLYRATKPLPFLVSGRIDIGELVTRDVQPPLYFVLLGGWFRLVGVSTWLAKWPSLAAGLVSLPLLWAVGCRWLGRRTALLATGVAAISPLTLWYSQEIRSYTLQVALGLLAVYSLVRACAAPRDRQLGGWLLLATAANAALLWTHYLGFQLLLFQVLLAAASVARAGGRRLLADRRLWTAVLVVGLLAWPLLPFAWHRLGLGAETDQHFVPLTVILRDVVHGFTFGWDPHPERVVWIDSLALLALGIGLAVLVRRKPAVAATLGGFLLLPVLGVFAITLVKPVYMGVRHILLASPPYFLLLAAGLSALHRRWPLGGLAAGAVLGGAMVQSCWGFYHDPAYRKDDLRALAQHVSRWAVPGDRFAVSDPRLVLAFEQLVDRLPVLAVPAMRADGRLDERPPAEQLAGVLPPEGRLWFMTPLPEMKDWLEATVARPMAAGEEAMTVPARARLVAERTFHGRTIPVRLDAYEAWGSLDRELASAQKPTDSQEWPLWWRTQPQPAVAGLALRVRIYAPDLAWPPASAVRRSGPAVPPAGTKLSLRLVDAGGRVWSQGDHALVRHAYPAFDSYDLMVEPVVPAGTYTLSLQLYCPGCEGRLGMGQRRLGQVTVVAGEAPKPRDLAIGVRAGGRGSGLELLGYDLSSRLWPAGGELGMGLWLRAVSRPPGAEGLRLEIVDGLGRRRSRAEVPLAEAGDSPAVWRPGDVRRLRLQLPLPSVPGRYSLRASLLSAGRPVWMRRRWLPVQALWLGFVQVTAPPREQPQAPDEEVTAQFGGLLELRGYDARPPVDQWPTVAGRPIAATMPITLHWRALARAPANYAVSVQMVPARRGATGDLEAGGPPLAQHDSQPALGARPCRGWQVGEAIADRHELALPQSWPEESLLIVAVYDPAAPEGARLAVEQSGSRRDYAILAQVAPRREEGGP